MAKATTTSRDRTTYRQSGAVPHPPPPPLQKFFKILNSRYIFKILENKPKKNYICPPQENYICPFQIRILVPSLTTRMLKTKPTKTKTGEEMESTLKKIKDSKIRKEIEKQRKLLRL